MKLQTVTSRTSVINNKNFIIAVIVTVAVGASGYFMLISRASGFFSEVEPERGTFSGGVALVSDAQASGGSAIQFGQGVPTTPGQPVGYKKLTPGTSWQWQLTGTIDETILDGISNPKKMYDVDLFETPPEVITRLKAKNIAVICYFSAGSAENWRSDYASFPAGVKGKGLDGWPGETWLDVRQLSTLQTVMGARMDLAAQKGCDGIEPDNIDGYANDTGFTLTAADQIAYNRMLATEAHKRGLSAGLKNDVDQISQLVDNFDWALNEQCYQYDECGGYSAFTAQNKAVFGVEYEGNTTTFCPKANAANYDWLKKDLNLGATPRTACRNG